MTHQWTERSRPTRLERRLEFPNYEATRDFLEVAQTRCTSAGIFPDISFGRTYVNLTLHAEGETLTDPQRQLAAELDSLMPVDGEVTSQGRAS